jgi:hypothetical protein
MSGKRRGLAAALAAAVAAGVLVVPLVGAQANNGHGHGDDSGKVLLFTSDGLRQDAVEQFADDGDVPGSRRF